MPEIASNVSDGLLAQELKRVVVALEATGRATLPASGDELLQAIVEGAARIFRAAAASLALVDEAQQALRFRVAYGVGGDQVVGLTIPLGQGVAGYVASTGQPLALSNVKSDTRFARGTAEKTGYVPRSILAVPLLSGERVIGVMEVLDKLNADSFGMEDMELLGLFARQAAMAIQLSQQFDLLGQAFLQRIDALVSGEGFAAPSGLRAVLDESDGEADDRESLLELAGLFNSISRLGERERQACIQVLTAFAGYVQSSPY